MRLLIVDDDEATCRGMKARILAMRFEPLRSVDTAFSAEEALAFAQAQEVDILLTDVKMVEMNGLELIREMQRLNPQICSVIMTAYANFEYAHQAIKLGVMDFLLKPFGREEMQQTLQKVIAQAQEKKDGEAPQAVNPQADPIAWAKQYVHTHIEEEINMSLVANKLDLSYSYFCKLFKQQTGQSFSNYISEEKMKEAAQQLRTGRKTHEVAEGLGYQRPQNFNRAFMRYWNCTPSEYRRQSAAGKDGGEATE